MFFFALLGIRNPHCSVPTIFSKMCTSPIAPLSAHPKGLQQFHKGDWLYWLQIARALQELIFPFPERREVRIIIIGVRSHFFSSSFSWILRLKRQSWPTQRICFNWLNWWARSMSFVVGLLCHVSYMNNILLFSQSAALIVVRSGCSATGYKVNY